MNLFILNSLPGIFKYSKFELFICTDRIVPYSRFTGLKNTSYIYIFIHRQTVSFYPNSSVWQDTQDARSRDRNPSNFTLYCVSDHSSTKRATLAKGILRYFYFWKQQHQPLFTFFNTLSATRVLNSFEELCITLAAVGNFFAREPHIYI